MIKEEDALRLAKGVGNYHRLNAVLKRVLGGKGRGEMKLAELEAALGWLERHRLVDHLHLLEGDARYAHAARRVGLGERRRLALRRMAALASSQAQPEMWRPPVGRPARTRAPVRQKREWRHAAAQDPDARAKQRGMLASSVQ